MKRLFAFALVLALSCTLWGCGGKKQEPTTVTTAPTTTAPVTTTEPATMPTVETNVPDPSVQTDLPDMTMDSNGGESQGTQGSQGSQSAQGAQSSQGSQNTQGTQDATTDGTARRR